MATTMTNAGFKFTDAAGNSGKVQGFSSKDRGVIEALVNLVNSYKQYVQAVKDKQADWALLSQANTFLQAVTLPAQDGALADIPDTQALAAKPVKAKVAELEAKIAENDASDVTIKMVDSEPVDALEPSTLYFYEAAGLLDGISVADPIEIQVEG